MAARKRNPAKLKPKPATAQREPVQGLNAEQRRRHARQPCRHAQVALHAMLFPLGQPPL